MIFFYIFLPQKKCFFCYSFYTDQLKWEFLQSAQQQQENMIKTFSIRLNKPRLVKWDIPVFVCTFKIFSILLFFFLQNGYGIDRIE